MFYIFVAVFILFNINLFIIKYKISFLAKAGIILYRRTIEDIDITSLVTCLNSATYLSVYIGFVDAKTQLQGVVECPDGFMSLIEFDDICFID